MEKCTGPNKVLLVLGWRTKFYWSWAGGQSFTGLGLEDKVLLVLGWSTGVHREDCIPAKFCCKQP